MAISVILLQGCASTSVTRLGKQEFPSKPADCDIAVMTDAPKARFQEVCLLEAIGNASVRDSSEVQSLIPQMKAKACGCGADALVLRTTNNGDGGLSGPKERAESSAIAIRYVR
jgi:hypothetical protein